MINVVVVDDSRVMRSLIENALTADGDIVVVGTAADPFEAREIIRDKNPDVITLDVEMPRMDGLEFMRRIMALRPMPVVMVSGATTKGAATTLEALAIGAFDFVAKPGHQNEWTEFANTLRNKTRIAASEWLDPTAGGKSEPGAKELGISGQNARRGNIVRHVPVSQRSSRNYDWPRCDLVAIGASTGGVTAINQVLDALPEFHPPVLIVQHMPPIFTTRFAERLAQATGRDIAEASNGEVLGSGSIRLAPGNLHLSIERSGQHLKCRLSDGPEIGNHRPSVDVLFNSVATVCGENAVGAILTGMGSDGATGLLQMREVGARTFGEAQSTCTVYGMPKAAMKIGAVVDEFPLDILATQLCGHLGSANRT